MTTVADYLDELRSLIGISEQPCGSNNAPPITTWYGMGDVPWCAETQSYALFKAGYDGFHYAYCPFIVRDAQAGVNGLKWLSTYDPDVQPGDLVLYCWDGSGVAEHVGCVEVVGDGTVTTIEGNTGGCDSVMRQVRDRNDLILGFARVMPIQNPAPATPAPAPTPAPVATTPTPTPKPKPKPESIEMADKHFYRATGKSAGITNKISAGSVYLVNLDTMTKMWVVAPDDLHVLLASEKKTTEDIEDLSCSQLAKFSG